MNTTPEKTSAPAPGYLARLVAALLGRAPAPIPAPAPVAPAAPAPVENPAPALRSEIAVLQADLADAGEKMGRMREEYGTLEADKARAIAAAGAAELQRVFKKLAAPLAMLSTLARKALAGEAVLAADLAQAATSVEKALAAGGLERIGEAGAQVPYDVSLHARMSGGAASNGEPVILQLPGYRFGGVVLHKAMVAVAEKPGQAS